MLASEMKTTIKDIVKKDEVCGVTAFAYITKDNENIIKKFLITDELRESVRAVLISTLENKFLADDVELEPSDNIADNKRILYEIVQTEAYKPFGFIESYDAVTTTYSERDQESLTGLLFKLNYNDKIIWAYQHIHKMGLIKRSRSVYAMFSGNSVYKPLDRDVLRIGSRIDVLIVGNSLITSNINLLQQSFGFDKYVRKEAAQTIVKISELGIVNSVERLEHLESKEKLTFAKKLMKAKNSPVLTMTSEELLRRIKRHSYYREKLSIEEDKIVIDTIKRANEFVKMLNDDIVKSELTDQEYDSPSKMPLILAANS